LSIRQNHRNHRVNGASDLGLRVDVSELGNLTRTGAEQLRRAGMNVDLQEIDFGSVARRRGN
jgi:hypothetical protein